MTIQKALNFWNDIINSMWQERKEDENSETLRFLLNGALQGLEEYVKNNKKRLIKTASNSTNNMTTKII